MNVHFIAIGGSAMHNLAIALAQKGYNITGSFGWFPEKINAGLDAIILGMHAKPDNPELLKAQELGVKIYSYPEFLYEQSKE